MSLLLDVKNLKIEFRASDRSQRAVAGVSFAMQAGETLAVVGESGSGKSVTALALTRLLPPPPACRIDGEILFEGHDVLRFSPAQLRRMRGRDIAYVFQEPSTSLNPVFRVERQIAEAIRLHRPDVKDVKAEVIQALEWVHIRDAKKRSRDYPHQLSGGMQQRVMIAMALACRPKLLVADEPTTALDVTIQAEVMKLLRELNESFGMSILLITHNFGIVSGFADNVVVMYRGKIVEAGPADEVLHYPKHPYTRALIGCIPRLGAGKRRLSTIDYGELDTEEGVRQP